jgi:selenide,water dikinase
MPQEVLVSSETGDDAAVYALSDGRALVATVDFFTPIVDDPFDWGRIAAANAFSDVYAMGGEPKLALNVAAWPVEDLPLELLADVLRGGQAIAELAGVVVLGGHTITDPEPKYGMVALGFVDPAKLVRNSTAPEGAGLFLTKPIGTGMISTAIKREVATSEQARAAVETMSSLNADAAAAMVEAGAAAATDVTGFGLLGHLRKMLEGSGVGARVAASAVPLLPGALDLARRDVVAGGTKRNLAWLNETTDWGELTPPERLVLADAQTSGGLLIATLHTEALRTALQGRGVLAAEIGVVEAGTPGAVTIEGRVDQAAAQLLADPRPGSRNIPPP